MDDSQVDNELDILQVSSKMTLDFKQDNLSKKIPDFVLLSLIANQYPYLITETNEITTKTVTKILREGANLNCLECLSDKIILDLVMALVSFNLYLKSINRKIRV